MRTQRRGTRRFPTSLLLTTGLALLIGEPSKASATTTLEVVHGWGFNNDVNGGPERTILTLKTFQVWAYGSLFAAYDITGPFTAADERVSPNEKNGISGLLVANLSIKRIGQRIAGKKEWQWGALRDLSLSAQLEHNAMSGAVTYFGVVVDFEVPFFDYLAPSALIRQDWSLRGVDLQLGGAWQATFPLGKITDLVLGGYFSWGMFGEGEGVATQGPVEGRFKTVPTHGAPFFIAQPYALLDIGKLSTLVKNTLFAGFRYQLAWNRYLQPGVEEHVPLLMFRWVI